MISYTEARNLYGSLTQNTSTTNLALFDKLANIEHKYLLQKYYSNEGSFSVSTVGAQSLTVTVAPSAGDTSATLTTAWLYHTTTAYVTFSGGDVRTVQFSRGKTTITWAVGLSESATTAISVGGLQFYPAPPNYSKLKTVTITVGNLQWKPTEILTRETWDSMNAFPYYSDIPVNFFIYPGGDRSVQIGIWPIPSTTGNTITYNYKFRVPDLSIADYTTGTVAVNQGETTVTGTTTVWTPTTNPTNESRWIRISESKGDNMWYQVASVDSATSLTLYEPYQGITVSGGSYTLGQMPLLMEDFQDMPVWKASAQYFGTIGNNPKKHDEHMNVYNEKLQLLEEYAGNKTFNVDLRQASVGLNPNLFQQNIGQ